jgi:plastocyanin
MRRLRIALLAAVVGALGAPAVAQAQDLVGTVGPDFTITLVRADGTRVTQLDPGTYRILIHDLSDFHNFHLTGPGVDQLTTVGQVGDVEWTVTFVEGRYTFVCDPHATQMRGEFVVGNPPPATPPPPVTTPPRPQRLTATVGPSFTISLRNAAGARVTTLRPGAYVITVRDRSRFHNFRLTGPGVRRTTSVGFMGTRTWTVRLRAGTYRFQCDPHKHRMKGSFRVRA